ncbi:hypothetical protein DZK27_14075 [Rhodobacteraceae bacterium 63075]|nr:hypothetical protein DZK27_14075 [Rhodobacteraceae bacterium 63075]
MCKTRKVERIGGKSVTIPKSFPAAIPGPSPFDTQESRLRQAAQELEASFLAEMLKSAGFGEAREAFGGGAGEQHFASFMVDAHAKNMAAKGGIGLAESIYESLKGDMK